MINELRFATLISMAMIAAGVSLTQDDSLESADFPVLTGPYLGQEQPGLIPKIFAPGVVSTINHEHSSLIVSPDGKEIFWSEITAPLSDQSLHRIVFTRQVDGCWAHPQTATFSGQHKDDYPFMSPDGSRLFFCSNRPSSDKSKEGRGHDIWFTKRTNTGWSAPELLGYPFTGEAKTWEPSVTNSGVMYFLGYHKDDQRDYGIYRSSIVGEQYAEPELLNESINTEYPDRCPYIAPDESYLIFSSKRPGGYGGFDLYVSFRSKNGSWIEPHNLGPDVNLKYHERFPGVSPDGRFLFFTRPNGKNNGDIYWVDARVLDDLKPEALK
jgi:hypothetical protein